MPCSTLLSTVADVPLRHCFISVVERSKRKRRSTRTLLAASNEKDLLSRVEEEVKAEQESAEGGAKGFGNVQKPKKKQKPKEQPRERPFKVDLSQGQEETPAQKLEGNVIRTLAAIFVVFLIEGLSLAIAGFLPVEWDDFITKYIYPAFSPTLGVFLTISVIYGLVKSRQGGKD